MKYNQFTIRKVPDRVREKAQQTAEKENKSLNAVLLESLEKGLGLTGIPIEHTDLDHFMGTWQEDPAFDEAVAGFDRVDPADWR